MSRLQTLKLLVFSMGLLLLRPAMAAPQEISATERVPNYDWRNRFPRWLTPTVVDATYEAAFASRIRPNGVAATSVSVDTRGIAHVAGRVDTNPLTPTNGTGGVVNWNYAPVIAYWNNRFDLRRNNGFSMRETVYTPPLGRSFTGPPDIWVDSNDIVHMVWSMDNPQNVAGPPGAPGNYPRIPSDIWYAMRGANGQWAVSNITNSAPSYYSEIRYTLPQIQVGSNGAVHIVCFKNQQYAQNQADIYGHVCWIQGQNEEVIEDSNTGLWAYLNGSPPKFVLNSSNQPVVAWKDLDNPGYDVCYSQRVNGSWTSKSGFGGVGYNDWPDVAVDPSDGIHLVWERISTDLQTPMGIHYRGPGDITAQLAFGMGSMGGETYNPRRDFGQPHVLCDSRGQVHVVYSGDRSFNQGPVNDGVFYAARVKNPGGSLSTSFSGQMPIAAPSQEIAMGMYDGALLNHVTHIARGKNDQIHVVGQGMPPDAMNMNEWANSDNYFGMYSRTMEYNLGVEDPAAMVGVLPGGSVNVTSGNFHFNVPLYSTNGISPCQSPQLVHNSLEFYSGLTAPGWKLNYEVYLIDHWLTISQPGMTPTSRPPSDMLFGPDCLTLFLPDGRAVFFRFNGSYHIPDESFGYFVKIERQQFNTLSPEYVLTTKHGDQWRFDSGGRLYRIQEWSGNRINLTYSQAGLLTQISDQTDSTSGGRSSTIAYTQPSNANRAPWMETITDPATKVYTVSYSGSALNGVSLPEGAVYSFEVGAMNDLNTGERVNLIQTLSRPGGSEWICRYLMDNRLRQVDDPSSPYLLESDGDQSSAGSHIASLSIDYEEPNVVSPAPPIAEPRETWVTDRRGSKTRYVVDARRSLALQIHDDTVIGGAPAGFSPLIRDFNQYGNLTSSTDRWGTVTTYSYWDSHPFYPYVKDNVLLISRGNTMLKGLTYTQNSLNKVSTESTYATPASGGSAVARTTTYNYDALSGQVSVISYPTVTLPDGSTQAASASYSYGGPRDSLSQVIDEYGTVTNFGNFHSLHGLPQTVTRQGDTESKSIAYDSMGNVYQERQPTGGEGNETPGWTTYDRDNLYRVTSITDPAGRQSYYVYNTASKLVTVTPPAGGQSTYGFDPRGFATGGSGPDGSWTQAVDANGNLRRRVDQRGAHTNMSYDGLNRLIQTRAQGGSTIAAQDGGGYSVETTTYVLDSFQNNQHRKAIIRSASGGSSRTTNQYFDSWGRMVALDEPDGATRQENFYDEQSNLVASQIRYSGELQYCTIQYRDNRDRVYRVRRQDGAYGSGGQWGEDRYTFYNSGGSPTLIVGPRGNPTQANNLTDKVNYTYDGQGRLFQVRQPIDGAWTVLKENYYGDDNAIKEVKIQDPTSASPSFVSGMKYTYTARKELKTAKNANNKGQTYTYLELPGQVETVTNALNQITRHTYHSSTQRLNQVTEAWMTQDEKTTSHTWQNGVLSEKNVWNPVTESNDAAWRPFYDYAGRLERLESPQGNAEVYRYSEFSERNLTTVGNKVVTSQFNGLGQEVARTVTGAFSASYSFGYDGGGNLSQVDDGTLRKDISWNIARGLAESESHYVNNSLWKTIEHEYDEGGNYVRMIYPDPSSTTHEWIRDDANRVTGIRVGGAEVCSMAYTKGGLLRLTTLRNASGTAIAQTTHDYDWLGRRIRSRTVRLPNQTSLSDLQWEYDHCDRISKIKYLHIGAETSIGYNNRGEVTSEQTTGNGNGQAPPPYDNTYAGIPTGNESNPSDEVMATPGAMMVVPNRSATYAYDKGGNRVTQTIDGVTTTLTYSAGNRLMSESRTGKTVSHVYDDWGNETERTTTESGTETVETYGYNAQHLMSIYVKSIGQSVQANWQYDYWPTGERYGKFNLVNGGGQLYVCNADNVVADYTVSGDLQNTYAQGLGIDAKSVRIPVSGSRVHYIGDLVGTLTTTITDSGTVAEVGIRDIWGNQLAGDTNDERYGFSQREHDMESGLVYMRHRMYDPKTGRFTQSDPLLRSRAAAHYTYASNNPACRIDPLGLADEDWREFLDSARKAGINFRPLTVARDTSLKWNARDSDINHYGSFNNTIYLGPSFKDPKTGKLKKFEDLGATQINVIFHELFHAAFDQVYEEVAQGNPDSQFGKDSRRLIGHMYENERDHVPMAPGDGFKLSEETLAEFAGAAAFSTVELGRFLSSIGRDARITQEEYLAFKQAVTRMTNSAKSSRGAVEPGKLWQFPTVTEAATSVTDEMATYVRTYFFNGMTDFLNAPLEADDYLLRAGFRFFRQEGLWKRSPE